MEAELTIGRVCEKEYDAGYTSHLLSRPEGGENEKALMKYIPTAGGGAVYSITGGG